MSTLREVAASGDRRDALRALLDGLTVAFEAADTKEKAGLARQIRDTLAELDKLGPVKPVEVDIVSTFRQPRTPRKSGAPRKASSAGKRRVAG